MRARPAISLADLEVLVVDDEADLRLGLRRLLERLGIQIREAADGLEALELLRQAPAQLVLTDLKMPRMTGSELLRAVKQRWPACEVIILTGFGTIQTAVACMHDGAAHFLTKPFDNDEVLQMVERLGRQVLARPGDWPLEASGLVARDPAMQAVLELVERAAPSPLPVLLEGESGTGKELVARMVHEKSRVGDCPFLAVNAAAFPDTLLEAELFGHEKGAFSGASRKQEGLFAQARGGTVFLDEVESMSASFQGKLLRVLQEKVVRPLGRGSEVPVAFRLISATNQDLQTRMREGTFREDLFFRLGVVRIHLPPLRERPKDILPLARHFLERAAALCLDPGSPVPELSPEAQEMLMAHTWPGNVRELENTIQRAVIVSPDGRIEGPHLGLGTSGWNTPAPGEAGALNYSQGKQKAIEAFQRAFAHRALQRSHGNISRAAEICGMTRAALQRILKNLDLQLSRYKEP